jgi:hypothetical protein
VTEPEKARQPYVYTNSASQVENYLTCARKWFLDSVLRLKGPQKPSAALGSRAHEISEAWLKHGVEPDGAECIRWTNTSKAGKTYEVVKYPGQIFMNGVHLLPRPGTVIVEGRFKTALPSGRVFSGARDQLGIVNGRAWVGDNKNVSSPMWALTADELHTNVQAQIYFYDVLTRYGVDEVDGQWTYFLTDESPNPPKKEWSTREQRAKWAAWVKAGRLLAWPVKVTAKRLPVLKQIAVIDQHAACMDELRLNVTNAQDVEPNTSGCDAYGGCTHKGTERCSLTVSQVYSRLANRGDIRTMALADLANQLAPAQAALAAANPGAVVPPPVAVLPKAWAPGDPLNATQAGKRDLHKSVFSVAMAADVAPDEDEALAWPHAKQVYVDWLAANAPEQAPAKRYWQPGDPLNDRQRQLMETAQPLWIIAVSGDYAMGATAAMKLPGAMAPYTPGLEGPPPVVMTTPIGQPESGRINPPEAPSVAAASPEQALALHQAAQAAAGLTQINLQAAEAFDDRKAIKAELERMGVCDSAGKPITQSSSHGTATLVALLKEARAKAAGGAPSVAPVSGTPVSAPAVTAPSVSAPAVTAPSVSAPYAAPISRKAFRLCVNTIPSVPHDTFAPIAAAALARFREKHDAAHYAGYDFGKGPGIFATYVEAYLVEGPGVPTGVLYVNTASTEARDALGALERLASEVYRGH